MSKRANCSPGNHPHSDQPNWRPAETYEDYQRNCADGLEKHSRRRAARLLGISHTELWRWELMAELPDDLFELLLAAKRQPTTKSLANVALALRGNVRAESECCPHCGATLRIRNRLSDELADAVNGWLHNCGKRA